MNDMKTNWRGVRGAIAMGVGIILAIGAVASHESPGAPTPLTLLLLAVAVYCIATGAVAVVMSAEGEQH